MDKTDSATVEFIPPTPMPGKRVMAKPQARLAMAPDENSSLFSHDELTRNGSFATQTVFNPEMDYNADEPNAASPRQNSTSADKNYSKNSNFLGKSNCSNNCNVTSSPHSSVYADTLNDFAHAHQANKAIHDLENKITELLEWKNKLKIPHKNVDFSPVSQAHMAVREMENQVNELLQWKNGLVTNNKTTKFEESGGAIPQRGQREHYSPIDKNNLTSSVEYFEMELTLNRCVTDVDKMQAAVKVFPRSIVEGFRRAFPNVLNWRYIDFREYVLNLLPQHYSCHRFQNFSRPPTLLDLDEAASKDIACPKTELYKFFIVHRAPKWAKNSIREHLGLDINQFKARVDSILTTGGSQQPSQQDRRYGGQSSLCQHHFQGGRQALSCEGPMCPMYVEGINILPGPSRPQPRSNQGNR